jgi:hypothetical protein
MEFIDTHNKIKKLERKIIELESQLQEKCIMISDIEQNMTSQYVENWTITDTDGEKGEFSGNMYWIKGEGLIFYKNGTHFEGSWDSTGEIIDGELIRNSNSEVISKWECGVEIGDEDDEDSDEDSEDEEDSHDDSEDEEEA